MQRFWLMASGDSVFDGHSFFVPCLTLPGQPSPDGYPIMSQRVAIIRPTISQKVCPTSSGHAKIVADYESNLEKYSTAYVIS